MLTAVGAAEAKPYPPLGEVFTDVFRAQPWHLQEQRAQLDAHLESYGDEYQLSLRHTCIMTGTPGLTEIYLRF